MAIDWQKLGNCIKKEMPGRVRKSKSVGERRKLLQINEKS